MDDLKPVINLTTDEIITIEVALHDFGVWYEDKKIAKERIFKLRDRFNKLRVRDQIGIGAIVKKILDEKEEQ